MCTLGETLAGGFIYKRSDCGKCDCPDSRVKHKPDQAGTCTECGQPA